MLARSLIGTDENERRSDAAHEALALARESDDDALLAAIAPGLLFALWAPGTADLRVGIAREAIETVKELGRSRQAANLFHAAYWAAVCAADVALATQ